MPNAQLLLSRFASTHSASSRADRIGVAASVLCALHCMLTPVLLLLAPAFGGLWSHPAAHWLAALFVVPLAGWMVVRGFSRHRKRWVVAAGILGMSLVVLGAALPVISGEGHEAAACTESGCCPHVVETSDGGRSLQIPSSAILTLMGGMALIVTHLGNLCACRTCRATAGEGSAGGLFCSS